jgi:hypothetical protein
MSIFVGIVCVLSILIIVWDAFETIILPRRVTRRFRLAAQFYRLTWRPWRALAEHIGSRRPREAFLGYYGPIATPLLLAFWAMGMILAFAGLHWALQTPVKAPEKHPNFGTYLYMSGTDYFTLGLGDVTAADGVGRLLTVLEAGTGFAFLAIIFGYFPVLYQAFSRREVNIALMDARAGSPSSALELLRHYSETSGMDSLQNALREMEHWTGELMESHISYPVLSFFRSQHDNQSWLAAITTILDSCALLIVGVGEVPIRQARLTFAMARHAVVDIAQILNASPRPPAPERLQPEEFARLRAALASTGLELRVGDEAARRLAELRKRYEPYVAALSYRLLLPLPAWAPERPAIHNWETSAWGKDALPGPGPAYDDHV